MSVNASSKANASPTKEYSVLNYYLSTVVVLAKIPMKSRATAWKIITITENINFISNK
jgi:hypothetical protein